MKNEVSAPRRWFTQRLEKYENSQLLFLDINVWINLVESPRDEWCAARQRLIELRSDHKVLCPVAAPLLWELYKQTYSSASGVALLMDQLSARTTLRQVDELYRSDVATLFEQLTGRPHPPAHRLSALLEKIPALHARADLAWAAGLDTNREDRPGDFYDLEMLKHALPYCDVFVTQDRWIKHLLRRATPQTLDRVGTTFLASPDELSSFLVSLY